MIIKHRIFINWLIGGVIASAIVWLAGAVFLTSPTIFKFDSDLGFANRCAGFFKQQRNENWVSFGYGKYGLEFSDSQKLNLLAPKLLIYGDSYIEAVMIQPEERIQNQFRHPELQMLGVGYSGIGCSEYAYLMKRFPKLMNNVKGQIIFTADVSDFSCIPCPDSPGGLPLRSSGFSDLLSYYLHGYSLRAVMRRWRLTRLDFAGNLWRNKNLSSRQENNFSLKKNLSQLKKAALEGGAPLLLIVYAPGVPFVRDGKVNFDDPNADFAGKLENECRRQQLGFINLGESFCRHYREKGEFVSGFFNTIPGKGHLNAAGHQIAAEAVSSYFKGK